MLTKNNKFLCTLAATIVINSSMFYQTACANQETNYQQLTCDSPLAKDELSKSLANTPLRDLETPLTIELSGISTQKISDKSLNCLATFLPVDKNSDAFKKFDHDVKDLRGKSLRDSFWKSAVLEYQITISDDGTKIYLKFPNNKIPDNLDAYFSVYRKEIGKLNQAIMDKKALDKISKKVGHQITREEIFPYIGSYPQDKSGAVKPIEWMILDIKDDKVLLLSADLIDAVPYHSTNAPVTWAKSSIRQWLNHDFMNKAFTKEEQEQILLTALDNQDNVEHDTYGGENTEDKIFLLSIDEVNKYVAETESAIGIASPYAVKNGAEIVEYYDAENSEDQRGSANWWLRTPGGTQSKASSFNANGEVDSDGFYVDAPNYAVRVAMWVKL